MKLGSFRIDWLEGGVFELDGGTMFGPVPRMLWQKRYAPDADNYIALTNRPILVRTGSANIVIETGLGNKLTDKQRQIFRVKKDWDIPGSLAALGLRREDITHLVLTHCDFDHAGGIVMKNASGAHELTFPRARHIIQRTEWEDVTNPNRRAQSTYWPVNYEGLEASGLMDLVQGDIELVSGVRLLHTGGHTRGHQAVWIESEGHAAIHMADLLPLHVQFNPLWVMSYDNFPLDAIDQKERLERMGLERNAWFLFYHDPFMDAARFDAKGVVAEKVVQ